jgi:hypothetical protein
MHVGTYNGAYYLISWTWLGWQGTIDKAGSCNMTPPSDATGDLQTICQNGQRAQNMSRKHGQHVDGAELTAQSHRATSLTSLTDCLLL